jgi:hypothetical protein
MMRASLPRAKTQFRPVDATVLYLQGRSGMPGVKLNISPDAAAADLPRARSCIAGKPASRYLSDLIREDDGRCRDALAEERYRRLSQARRPARGNRAWRAAGRRPSVGEAELALLLRLYLDGIFDGLNSRR